MQKWIALVCLLVCCGSASAQADTAQRRIDDVVVTGTRAGLFSTGSKSESFDSLSLAAARSQNLADLLSQQSPIFIKTYGLGGLATASFRGSNAYHTAVLWNGFNLQNATYGQFDFALMPLEFADEAGIQYGGNGALFGSGAIGGIVQLNTLARFGSSFHVGASLGAGSFSHFRQSISVSYGSKKWYTVIRAFNQQAKNDFPYTNTAMTGEPRMRQSNAGLSQQAVLNEHYFKLSDQQELNFRAWYQHTNRGIPPTMSQLSNVSVQDDESLRLTAEWKLQQKKYALFARTAWFNEKVFYDDTITGIEGRNRSQTSITEAEARFVAGSRHAFNVGVNNTYVVGHSLQYDGTPYQERFALFASWKYTAASGRLITSLSARGEWVTHATVPPIPAAGFEWKPLRHVKVYGNVAASYRVPSLNDLYWVPGGNASLKPETGWGEELSMAFDKSSGKVGGMITLTGFNRNTNNWILWLPQGSYWSPQNILKVWSRGAEGSIRLGFTAGRLRISAQSKAAFTLSTNEADAGSNDDSKGRQLIYVPRVSQQHQVSVQYKRSYISYLHSYTGIRFTASDNSAWIGDFQLGTLRLGQSFNLAKTRSDLSLSINNLWNARYQAVLERPMPGINYFVTINISI